MRTKKEAEQFAKELRLAVRGVNRGKRFSVSCDVSDGGAPYFARIVCRARDTTVDARAAAYLTGIIYDILEHQRQAGEIGSYAGRLWCRLGRPIIEFGVHKPGWTAGGWGRPRK